MEAMVHVVATPLSPVSLRMLTNTADGYLAKYSVRLRQY